VKQRPWYAINARQLLEQRQAGNVPADPVYVVLNDDPAPAPALYVKPDMPVARMDWRMLVNVDVWLWATPAVELARVLAVCAGIAAARPADLTLRFCIGETLHDIGVGWGTHFDGEAGIPPAHWFTWAPVNLNGSDVGGKLRRALLGVHPRRTRL
jgi:hypothetical protein